MSHHHIRQGPSVCPQLTSRALEAGVCPVCVYMKGVSHVYQSIDTCVSRASTMCIKTFTHSLHHIPTHTHTHTHTFPPSHTYTHAHTHTHNTHTYTHTHMPVSSNGYRSSRQEWLPHMFVHPLLFFFGYRCGIKNRGGSRALRHRLATVCVCVCVCVCVRVLYTVCMYGYVRVCVCVRLAT